MVAFQSQTGADGVGGVRVGNIVEDNTPGKRVHDPKHPMADPEGYVTQSNVNAVEEMVNMISASRSYQNNVEIMEHRPAADVEDAAAGPVTESKR
jgi:flagellar basal-body rod protein FlgC